MARYTGPKQKLQRRAGVDLGLKTNAAKVAKRLNIPPGQHGRRGSRKLSDFGVQLKEKQKVKWIYGIMEKQFRNLFEIATKNPEATGSELLSLLETRLDNTVYRLGFAPTRASARQLVAHGHVRVNQKKLDIPSYQVKIGDTINLTSKALKIPAVAEIMEEGIKNIPAWLKRKQNIGQVAAKPTRDDIDADINENLIVEYYSR
jgi:small subunit ribosomal protein S4